MTTTIAEKYQLYYLHILAEVMTDEMSELMRYGITPLGAGYVPPLKKDLQQKIGPLLAAIADRTREATEKMIQEAMIEVSTDTAKDWMTIMLTELENRSASVGGEYTHELDNVKKLINQVRQILIGAIDSHEEKQPQE